MKIKSSKTQIKQISTRTGVAALGTLLLVGSIGMTCQLTNAAATNYSLTGSSVALNGTANGTATVTLKNALAKTYVAIQGNWSTSEEVETGETQTSYLTLSGLKLGSSTTLTFDSTTGTVAWTPLDGNGVAIPANGSLITATYTVDKDTPAGSYKVIFTDEPDGVITYDENGTDVDEADAITLNATITVTRSGSSGDGDGSDSTTPTEEEEEEEEGEIEEEGEEEKEEEEDEDGLLVPNTGRMSEENSGANAVAISIVSIIATATLITTIIRAKAHKKLSFDKIKR